MCNNVTNNDTMVDVMGNNSQPPDFKDHFAHVHYFLYILNLVTKSLIKQFDMGSINKDTAKADIAEKALMELAEEMGKYDLAEEDMDTNKNKDNVNVNVSLMAEMSDEELAQFDEEVWLVKLVLEKVSLTLCLLSNAFESSASCTHYACLDLNTILQDNQLYHQVPSYVEGNVCKPQEAGAVNATRCLYLVKLDVQYVRFCNCVLEGGRQDDSGKVKWATKI